MCGVQVKDRKIDGTQRSMERAMCGVQVKDIKREVTQYSAHVRSTGPRYKVSHLSFYLLPVLGTEIYVESNVRSTGQRYL